MNPGFVVSDKVRSVVFAAIVKGERDLAGIAKRHRLILRAAERAARELVESGLVARADAGYRVTEAGEEVARALRKDGTLGAMSA